MAATEGSDVNTQLMQVRFYEDSVVLIEQENEPHLVMKPIAESLGVSWQGQHAKLSERFASTIKEILIVAEDGKPGDMTCLHLRKLPAWLYSIRPLKVKPELRDKIIRSQKECDDALWNYWTEGRPDRLTAPNTSQQIALSRHRVTLLKELYKTRDNVLRSALHEQLSMVSHQLGLLAPALEMIGRSTPDTTKTIEELWSALEQLDRLGVRYNHVGSILGAIALNYPQIKNLFKEHHISVQLTPKLREALIASQQPKLLDYKLKSHIEGKSVRCWIFEGPIRPDS